MHQLTITSGLVLDQKYEIVELLGQGGMGAVYRAKHLLLQKDVAVKILRAVASENQEALKRFQREAKLVSQLQHKNIVAVLSFGVSEFGPYLVEDFLSGKPLDQLLATQGPLTVEQFRTVFSGVCSGLSHAHEQQIIHRDIKPANIFVVEEPDGTILAKLVDFGIAKQFEQDKTAAGQHLTSTGVILGTPLYMSPEQFTGQHSDVRSDIYSLGCVMYESCYGNKPFAGESPFELVAQHAYASPEFEKTPAGYPSGVRALLARAMAKSPEQRYQSTAELRGDLERIDKLHFTGIPKMAVPPRPVPRRQQKGKLPPKWLLGGAITTLIMAAAAVSLTHKPATVTPMSDLDQALLSPSLDSAETLVDAAIKDTGQQKQKQLERFYADVILRTLPHESIVKPGAAERIRAIIDKTTDSKRRYEQFKMELWFLVGLLHDGNIVEASNFSNTIQFPSHSECTSRERSSLLKNDIIAPVRESGINGFSDKLLSWADSRDPDVHEFVLAESARLNDARYKPQVATRIWKEAAALNADLGQSEKTELLLHAAESAAAAGAHPSLHSQEHQQDLLSAAKQACEQAEAAIASCPMPERFSFLNRLSRAYMVANDSQRAQAVRQAIFDQAPEQLRKYQTSNDVPNIMRVDFELARAYADIEHLPEEDKYLFDFLQHSKTAFPLSAQVESEEYHLLADLAEAETITLMQMQKTLKPEQLPAVIGKLMRAHSHEAMALLQCQRGDYTNAAEALTAAGDLRNSINDAASVVDYERAGVMFLRANKAIESQEQFQHATLVQYATTSGAYKWHRFYAHAGQAFMNLQKRAFKDLDAQCSQALSEFKDDPAPFLRPRTLIDERLYATVCWLAPAESALQEFQRSGNQELLSRAQKKAAEGYHYFFDHASSEPPEALRLAYCLMQCDLRLGKSEDAHQLIEHALHHTGY